MMYHSQRTKIGLFCITVSITNVYGGSRGQNRERGTRISKFIFLRRSVDVARAHLLEGDRGVRWKICEDCATLGVAIGLAGPTTESGRPEYRSGVTRRAGSMAASSYDSTDKRPRELHSATGANAEAGFGDEIADRVDPRKSRRPGEEVQVDGGTCCSDPEERHLAIRIAFLVDPNDRVEFTDL